MLWLQNNKKLVTLGVAVGLAVLAAVTKIDVAGLIDTTAALAAKLGALTDTAAQ